MKVWLVEASKDQYEPPHYVGIYTTERKADEAIKKAKESQEYGWDCEYSKVEFELDEVPKG